MNPIPFDSVLYWLQRTKSTTPSGRQFTAKLPTKELLLPSTLPHEYLMAVATLFFSGCRAQEACNINNSDVELSTHHTTLIHIKSLKGGSNRIIPARSAWLMNQIESYRPYTTQSGCRPFLVTPRPQNPNRAKIYPSVRAYPRYLQRLIHNLFGHSYSPHSFRHCFALHLLNSGVDVRHIQHALGHRSLNTTSIYLSVLSLEKALTPIWEDLDAKLTVREFTFSDSEGH